MEDNGTMKHLDLSASIVIYRTPIKEIENCLKCLCNAGVSEIFIVNNSPSEIYNRLALEYKLTYLELTKNIGFGKAHNIAIHRSTKKFHLVINADVSFDQNVPSRMIETMEKNVDAVAAGPAVLYPDGEPQYVYRNIPTVTSLLSRRFFSSSIIRRWLSADAIYVGLPEHEPVSIPCLSGCFFIAKTDALQKVGGFDPRYFMYMEDIDISRQLLTLGKILHEPRAVIYHKFGGQSRRYGRLFVLHCISAIRYFAKWGFTVSKKEEVLHALCQMYLEKIPNPHGQ
jgi:GT2 family glycosyltransferase